jgi:hypothetical protein
MSASVSSSPDGDPVKSASYKLCPSESSGDTLLGQIQGRALCSFGEALEAVAFLCGSGAVVVLENVPPETRAATLRDLSAKMRYGKPQWSVRNALGGILTHTGDTFPAAERFIIDGYVPLRGGEAMEVAFQMNVAKKCGGSPVFVLTEKWPEPTTLGFGPQNPYVRFAWAKGFFTPQAEVMHIRYRATENSFEVTKGIVTSEGETLRFTLPPARE